MISSQPRISVIVCTRDRASSVGTVLECLASANREGISAEVIVVDNASRDHTNQVVASFSRRIPVRYLYEPTLGVCGKSHALNRALDAGCLGDIIAVLDDDMSPEPAWFQGVLAISNRWPARDIFTGDTYAIWPHAQVPEWAKKPQLQSWIYSSCRVGPDLPMEEGRWFSGNHWWFRSRVLACGLRFRDIWLSEADFQLNLVERGFRGVAGRDAVAGHRIQPAMLQREVVLERARKTGIEAARLRLHPYRTRVKQARMLSQHPWLGRSFCLANHWRWRLLSLISHFHPSPPTRFANRLIAIERSTTYLELLRTANELEDYRPRRAAAGSG